MSVIEGHGEMMTCPGDKAEERNCGSYRDQPQAHRVAFQEKQDGENLWDTFELLQIDLGCESSTDQCTGNPSCCSKNVLRKQRHWEKIVLAKKNKRKHERERRKARRAEEKGAAALQLSKRELKAIAKERLLEAKETGPWLCVDLSMTSHMSQKEISRLAAQIRRLYGSNKKAQEPFCLYLTGFVKSSPIHEACVRMNDGFAKYLMDVTPESYLDLFPLEKIVYLTPDAENGILEWLVSVESVKNIKALEGVDPQKVYVLGGLVDESIQKRLTFQRAQEEQLQTARLPIHEYMVKNINVKNYHSTTLTINQVFDALLTFHETKSWVEALKAAVSPGKGYIFQDTTL